MHPLTASLQQCLEKPSGEAKLLLRLGLAVALSTQTLPSQVSSQPLWVPCCPYTKGDDFCKKCAQAEPPKLQFVTVQNLLHTAKMENLALSSPGWTNPHLHCVNQSSGQSRTCRRHQKFLCSSPSLAQRQSSTTSSTQGMGKSRVFAVPQQEQAQLCTDHPHAKFPGIQRIPRRL